MAESRFEWLPCPLPDLAWRYSTYKTRSGILTEVTEWKRDGDFMTLNLFGHAGTRFGIRAERATQKAIDRAHAFHRPEALQWTEARALALKPSQNAL